MVYKEFSHDEKVIVVNEPKRDNGWATKAPLTFILPDIWQQQENFPRR